MQKSSASENSRYVPFWAVVVCMVALIPRVLRAWESREDILHRSTPDDAYYYFGIARNTIEGNGPSFDGEHVTNGFHPLWQALITPFWLFGGDTPIHLALTLGAICGSITAALVFLFLQRATGTLLPGLLGAGFFALHPQIISDSVNGLESAVSVLLIAVVLLALTHLDFAPRHGRRASLADIAFGVVLGLLMLARTDMVFVVAASLFYVLIRMGRKQLVRPIIMGAIAALCMVPWFTWSLVATGSLVQISGRAGGVYFRDAYIAEHGHSLSTKITRGIEVARTVFTEELPHSYFAPTAVPEWLSISLGLASCTVIAYAAFRSRGRYADAALALSVVALGFALSLAFHGGVRWFTRSWYYTPAAMLGAVALGMTAHGVLHLLHEAMPRGAPTTFQRARWAAYGAIAAVLVVAYKPYDAMSWSGENEGTLQMYEAGRWLATNTPEEARTGSFNGGIIGYFSDKTVVNLDGVVNEGAYEAIASCRMTEYVRDEQLDFVVDFQRSLVLASCGPPVVEYQHVVTLDNRPSFFGAIDVLRVVPIAE